MMGRRREAVLPYGLNPLYAIRLLKLSQSKYGALVKIKIVCVEFITNTITITDQVGGCAAEDGSHASTKACLSLRDFTA